MRRAIFRVMDWLLRQSDSEWTDLWIKRRQAMPMEGLNTEAFLWNDAQYSDLQRASEIWKTKPSEALADFLRLAENGSVWSMLRVGGAYESGMGAPVDLAKAEYWYNEAYDAGSDYGLLRTAAMTARRGDKAGARAILNVGVARGLAPAMRALAHMELLSGGRNARPKAKVLYEQAIALGDIQARLDFSRAMIFGRFGLKAVPEGIRNFRSVCEEIRTDLDLKRKEQS